MDDKKETKEMRRLVVRTGLGLFLLGVGAYAFGKKIGGLEATNKIQYDILNLLSKSASAANGTDTDSVTTTES